MTNTLHVGTVVGKWILLRQTSKATAKHKGVWWCRCRCGKEQQVGASVLTKGLARIRAGAGSCGCRKCSNLKHGHATGYTHSKTHAVWSNMVQRCSNKNSTYFTDYGGRGIKVCQRWLKFENFLADMGEQPEGMTIDRIDNDGNYTPTNCRWADRTTQNRNSRHTRFITIGKRTMCLTEWGIICKTNITAILGRASRKREDIRDTIKHFINTKNKTPL